MVRLLFMVQHDMMYATRQPQLAWCRLQPDSIEAMYDQYNLSLAQQNGDLGRLAFRSRSLQSTLKETKADPKANFG